MVIVVGWELGCANRCLCPCVHIYVCIVKPDIQTIHYVTPKAVFIALWTTVKINRNPTKWSSIRPQMVFFACEMLTSCTLVSRF